jgi:hypothetical protein
LESPTHAIDVLGLPHGRHRLHPGRGGAIPSKLDKSCATLHLGLALPVKLDLRFLLHPSFPENPQPA